MDGDGGENLAALKGTHHFPPWMDGRMEGWRVEVATSLKRAKFEEIIRSTVWTAMDLMRGRELTNFSIVFTKMHLEYDWIIGEGDEQSQVPPSGYDYESD